MGSAANIFDKLLEWRMQTREQSQQEKVCNLGSFLLRNVGIRREIASGKVFLQKACSKLQEIWFVRKLIFQDL